MISEEAYKDLEEAVGPDNVSMEAAVLDGYAWQPMINDDPSKWVRRPVAVALPGSTEEVQAVVRACNEHGLKFKAFSTGWGIYGGPTTDNVVQIDLRRMDRVLEIDEKNMYAVVEPYVSGAQLQAEAMKVGLNTHIIGAGPACSPLASATSFAGVGWDGIYMSYSSRNVLGVEWVLPDGETLELGSPGSGLGWFSGDGPGPSLRGLMRGSIGALSGIGVFTKCALKLYNWQGPPQVETEGMLLEAKSKLPDNLRYHLFFFPDRTRLAEATYKIGEAEIGYLASRTSSTAFMNFATPHLLAKIARTKALRDVLSKVLKWGIIMILAADSEEELAYQEGVLKKIISDYGGMSMEMGSAEPIISMFLMNFIRVTAVPLTFRRGGLFGTALGRNETWDTQLDWAEAGEEIKRKWIDRGLILDDLADNPFMVIYENNMWSHCEEIYLYDPHKEKQMQALEPILVEFTIAAIERNMESFSSTDPRIRKIVSPMMGNYNRWQKSISGAFDANRAADSGMYCEEIDFDFSGIEPELLKRLEKSIGKYTWKESGPLESE
jgi:glycolate oxidase